jgi:hypothetical protein
MNNFTTYILALGFILLLTGCASKSSKPNFTEESSGFLINYDLLTPVNAPEDIQIYVYNNDAIESGDYDAAIVEPVFIYEGAIDEDTISYQNIENAKRGINTGLNRAVAEYFETTDTPAPGVFRMQVAITGANLEGAGLKPWNIIPVSAAITLATHATNTENKRPVLMVELKITDSQTGEILKEVLTISSGEYFRNLDNTSAAFEQVADDWVALVLEYSDIFIPEY